MTREQLPEPIVATINLLQATAMEIFDVTAVCMQEQTFTADDWELLRATLAHASAALTAPAINPTP